MRPKTGLLNLAFVVIASPAAALIRSYLTAPLWRQNFIDVTNQIGNAPTLQIRLISRQ